MEPQKPKSQEPDVPEHNPEPQTSGKPGNGGWDLWPAVIAGILFGLILYVLSIGPAFAIRERYPMETRQAIRVIYAPLFWLHDNTALKQPLEWYTSLYQ